MRFLSSVILTCVLLSANSYGQDDTLSSDSLNALSRQVDDMVIAQRMNPEKAPHDALFKFGVSMGAGIAEGGMFALISTGYGKEGDTRTPSALIAVPIGYLLGCSNGTYVYGTAQGEKGSYLLANVGALVGGVIGASLLYAGASSGSPVLMTLGATGFLVCVPIGSIVGYNAGKHNQE